MRIYYTFPGMLLKPFQKVATRVLSRRKQVTKAYAMNFVRFQNLFPLFTMVEHTNGGYPVDKVTKCNHNAVGYLLLLPGSHTLCFLDNHRYF